ncbi:MAG TPA: Ig-like domain-containing protein [Bryobacteraceae bacterium]|nr:Ig-like domain-containing protein [Bryobacteraceae bacterium]
MRHGIAVALIGLAAVSGCFAQSAQAEHVAGRLLVQNNGTVDDSVVQQVLGRVGAKVHHKIVQNGVWVIEVPEQAAGGISQALERSGLFKFVEPDFVAHGATTPNDPDFSSQWHLSKIQAPSAWGLTLGSISVPIAVLDSGVDPTHPDLIPKLIPGWNFLTGNADTADNGALGGHGTAVSGTAAAATNNATGVAGVGWANTIMPLVVLDASNYATYSNIASAIDYAADHGVRIISISIAGSSSSSTLQSAVDYAWSKGSVVFAAAGNFSTSAPYYPAACTNVVAVSATESDDTFSSFSNYGSWITLSAPGDYIMTTDLGGSYGQWYGTSFAAPIAAGVAALAISANPSLTASALVTLLKNNSDDLGTAGYDIYFGWGRVNAYKAVLAAKNSVTPTDTKPPVVSISSPLSGVTVAGTVAVQGSATDNVGVTKIQFYVDGSLMSSAAVSPFAFSWNSTAVANGSHTLTVKAYDAANNVGSASVAVIASNDKTPPAVSIGSPTSGSSVAGTLTVKGSATDNVGVTKVQLYVDGVLAASGTASAFSFSWNSTTVTNASHTLTVKAYDAAGNVGSAAVTVTVNNPVVAPPADTQPPVVAITSPLNGTSVSRTVAVNVSARDNVGVTRVAIYIDGVQVYNGTAAPYTYNWNTHKASSGNHTITATAWDAAGNAGHALPVTVTR